MTSKWDSIIIGGGAAGLSAALVLGRARRRVLLVDSGGQRNLAAAHSHSYLTRDGTPPRELVQIGRRQLENYPTVTVLDDVVASAARTDAGFEVALRSGHTMTTKTVVLAVGVRDVLPAIPGLAERWGKTVFHCPYCHGFEVLDEPLGILLGEADDGVALAQLMAGWSRDLVLFSDGRPIAAATRDELRARNVPVREERVVRLVGEGPHLRGIQLEGGETVARSALMLRPPQVLQSPLADQLGCVLQPDGLVRVAEDLQTSVPGVYAAGDCLRRAQQVVFAAADGALAAMSVNRRLLAEDWARPGTAD